MKKVSEYRTHAEECRMLAKTARTAEHRAMLMNMAGTWDTLAETREKTLVKEAEGQGNPTQSK
jgi:hypothetical protein